MLKKIRVLFLGLVVLAGSACVTPTHASSAAGVIISRVQAAGASGAKEELVVIHNNSSLEIDVTGWCLTNKTAIKFVCLQPTQVPGYTSRYGLAPYASISIASNEYIAASGHDALYFPIAYAVTNQSSGTIVTSSDTISLYDADDQLVDSKSWATTIPSGKGWSRLQVTANPLVYASTGAASDWVLELVSSAPITNLITYVEEDEREDEVDPDIPQQPDENPQPEVDEGTNEPFISELVLSEILANPSGSDTGNEFIELYNSSSNTSISLDAYKLRIGFDTPKWYGFPSGASLEPLSYKVFSDTEMGFTLTNTGNRIQLYKGEQVAGVAVEYISAKDDQSWAFINGTWQYTKQLTPGFANMLFAEAVEDSVADENSEPKPCATNQFRNPETGRCKLIATTVSSPAPCKEGQERNPETNRCRNIATIGSTLTPCKEGQERNQETNRCRNIVKMTNAGEGIKGVSTESGEGVRWYYWLAIAGVVLAILGYGIWEWRAELTGFYRQLSSKFAKKAE